jgi:sporulation protein YlmC with PRC-barrel domain
MGKRVLTEGGDGLGTVNDVEFDPADGSIRAILTGTEEIAGPRMLGLGSYAVVVRA